MTAHAKPRLLAEVLLIVLRDTFLTPILANVNLKVLCNKQNAQLHVREASTSTGRRVLVRQE